MVVPTREEAATLRAELGFYLGRRARVLLLPADDTRAWEGRSPHPELPRQRLAALDALERAEPAVVIAPARAVLQRVPAPAQVAAQRLWLRVGDEVDPRALLRQLVDRGYLVSQSAEEPGTVCQRGGVVDIWPAQLDHPVRMEIFGEELETMRAMDPVHRKGREALTELLLLPAREAVIDEEALRRAALYTQRAVDENQAGHGRRRRVLAELKEGLWFPGAEDYLPALHPVISVLEWPRSALVVVEPAAVEAELHKVEQSAWTRYASLPAEERPCVLPADRFCTATEALARLSGAIELGGLLPHRAADTPHLGTLDNRGLRVSQGEMAPVAGKLSAALEEGKQVALCADSGARAERLVALLVPHGLRPEFADPGTLLPPGRLALWIGPLARGFSAPQSDLLIVTADELFGPREKAAPRHKGARDAIGGALADLKVGDLIVHPKHGVGRFIGLKRIVADFRGDAPRHAKKLESDFAELSYRNGDRLFLPVTQLDQLERFRVADGAEPALDKLGGVTWAAKKAKVKDKISALAFQLVELYAQRQSVAGHAYDGPLPELYHQFEAAFPYTETDDQLAAIRDVLDDLAKNEPMDRLIVGDVGFGKTEVAMRATLRVVLENRQVAVLCPTTVLAFQHYETFKARFADLPVRVELLSGLRAGAEGKRVVEDIAKGSVDIVIGTSSLLGRSLKLKRLGLVVVDEEHRFGVKQKEKLKSAAMGWATVPCEYLAMSATPIPRSLHMALSGLRAVSSITTPPHGRQPVITRVSQWNDAQIRDDILYELHRGGQVFFVHNRVESIHAIERRLFALVPEATVAVAHGQMEPGALEAVLVGFVQRKQHILLCTTIIESGVDMPQVNTILVNDAHELGLAQLHQLRGRVGRGSVRGRCTLLVPEGAGLTAKAMARLKALQDHTELGAGFAIASADLELRGAGDLLGESQHGHIEAVGLDTYITLLEEAIASARGEVSRARLEPELEIPVPALLPDVWIDDLQERLTEYRRLAAARTVHEVRDVLSAWESQYGAAPPEVLNLGWLAEAKVRCRELGIERLTWLGVRVLLDLHEGSPIPAAHLTKLITGEPARFALAKGGERRLEVRFTAQEAEYPFRFLHWVFGRLGG